MSDQDGRQAVALPRPSPEDTEGWKTYWQAQGQPWRTEPEIDTERQKYLKERNEIEPDIWKDIYPFKDIKLSRADVEWLLATHEDDRGPLDWDDESQRTREGLFLLGANLCHEDLGYLPLAKTFLRNAQLEDAFLIDSRLEGADLANARLQKAVLVLAKLQGADLSGAQLEKADLGSAKLQGANLIKAEIQGAKLDDVALADEHGVGPRLVDVQWGNTNLAVVDWSQITMLGDKYEALKKLDDDGEKKDKRNHLKEYKVAIRADRQLAVVLRAQGLNEEADRFAYRAQVLQKSALWYQMTERGVPFSQRIQALGGLFFSWFLFLLAGYGYKPIRSVIAYLVIIFGFMGLYLLNAHFIAPHLTWDEALVLSVSSFHGRGFFTQNVTLGDTYARLASVEAIVGLFIEISFIATFTQRFFGK
jgi:hypothetical protein